MILDSKNDNWMIDTFLLISTVNLFWKMIRSACVHSPSVASLNPEGALPGANVTVVVAAGKL